MSGASDGRSLLRSGLLGGLVAAIPFPVASTVVGGGVAGSLHAGSLPERAGLGLLVGLAGAATSLLIAVAVTVALFGLYDPTLLLGGGAGDALVVNLVAIDVGAALCGAVVGGRFAGTD